ncbi:G-protein coupled receptor moody-like [Patiria miniata]|uniref:G-protein coupled receptors family 1 profile domain-containing protein n=1 Tax=Patiria miniata TaxID=46514 RepID=A0A914A7U4_PATMI|nr:G-protein coupled receptor moody-like [Patiria miniata]
MAFNASESDMDGNQAFYAVELSVIVFVWHLLIVVLGVPGNVLILIVFLAKPRRTSTAVLIMALAAADLFACLARLCEVVYQGIELSGSAPPTGLFVTITVVNNLSLTAAALMTALIALDRYDCICRHSNRLLSHRRSCGAVVFICCLTLCTNIPLFVYLSGNLNWYMVVFSKQVLFYFFDVLVVFVCYGRVYAAIRKHVRVGVNRLTTAGHNPSVLSDTSASGRRNVSRYETRQPPGTIPAIAAPEMPCCSANTAPPSRAPRKVFLDSKTRSPGVTSLSRSLDVTSGGAQGTTLARGGSKSPGSSQRESLSTTNAGQPRASTTRSGPPATLQRRTTRMLFLATLIFLLTYIPYWIFVGMAFAGRPHDAVYHIMRNVLHLMFLNNAVNPLIYGVANRRFRKDVRDVLRKMCGRKSTE